MPPTVLQSQSAETGLNPHVVAAAPKEIVPMLGPRGLIATGRAPTPKKMRRHPRPVAIERKGGAPFRPVSRSGANPVRHAGCIEAPKINAALQPTWHGAMGISAESRAIRETVAAASRGGRSGAHYPPGVSHPRPTALNTNIAASVATPACLPPDPRNRHRPAVMCSVDRATNAAHLRTTAEKNRSELRDGFKKARKTRSVENSDVPHRRGALSTARSTKLPKRQGN